MFTLAHAATYSPTIPVIQKAITHIVNPLIGFFFAMAFIVFLWGIFEFIAGSNNEEKVTAGKQHMLWGVIGIFIMISVFGIMNLVCSTIDC